MKLLNGAIYKISWNDTYAHLGHHSLEDIDSKTTICLQETLGFFIKETPDFYIIAQHKNKNPDFMPWSVITWIPKGCVKKIQAIR